MGKGFLQVQLYLGDFTLHGQRMAVQVMKDGVVVYAAETDEGGATEVIGLDAPDLTSGAPAESDPFETYDVIVPEANGFKKVSVYGVQIFDGITSVLDIHLEPLSEFGPQEINIYVSSERGVTATSDINTPRTEATDTTPPAFEELALEVFRQFITKPTRPLPDNFDMTTFLLALILLKS